MAKKSKAKSKKAAGRKRPSSRRHARHQRQDEIDEQMESQPVPPMPPAMPPIPNQPPGSALVNPFAALFQRAPSSLTRENIVKDLTSPDNYELKTRIRNEFSMAGLDTFGFATTVNDERRKEMLRQYGIFTAVPNRIGPGEMILFYGARVRLNAYSTNMGESRREVVAALHSVEFAEDKMKGRKVLEGLFSESK
jgi:hypothetical protein